MDNQKYFFQINNLSSYPANLLEKDISQKVKNDFKNSLLNDRENFISQVETMLHYSNNAFKRCRPIKIETGTDPLSKEKYIDFVRKNRSILLRGRFILVQRDFSDIQKTSSNEN